MVSELLKRQGGQITGELYLKRKVPRLGNSSTVGVTGTLSSRLPTYIFESTGVEVHCEFYLRSPIWLAILLQYQQDTACGTILWVLFTSVFCVAFAHVPV